MENEQNNIELDENINQDENTGSNSDNQENISNDENENNQADTNNSEEIYGAPETFDYSEVKLPEGMVLDDELVKEFEPVAKKLNLSNKSANELMQLAVKLSEKNISKFADYAQSIQQAKKMKYQELLNTDKELNVSDDAKYNQYLDVSIQGLKAVATPGFIELLKTEGLTHHPDFIKTFHKIGELCTSEKIPDVKIPAGQKELSAAEILYGNKK